MPYYFNLPLITELTIDQQRAVDETNTALALSGGPGTGKSVVCLWRHISNHSTGLRESLLLTYTKTLEHYLRASAKNLDEDAAQNIGRTNCWLYDCPDNQVEVTNFDEIIIDEGQDIEKSTFQRYFEYTENLTYGADKRQSMYLSKEKLKELFEWFKTEPRFSHNEKITLNRNFRNSKEILLFTRSVFPNFLISNNAIASARETGLKPIMKINLGWGAENQVDDIVQIINDFKSDTHNIAVLLPFASKVNTFYDLIKDRLDDETEITKFQNEMAEFEGLAGIHVTTFHSSKGTEFDTVIIPEFDSFNKLIADPKFDMITENSYYVSFTRAKTNLFLLCTNGFPSIGNRETIIIE
jgi:superfamily I DNA/RNA helicase